MAATAAMRVDRDRLEYLREHEPERHKEACEVMEELEQRARTHRGQAELYALRASEDPSSKPETLAQAHALLALVEVLEQR